MVDEYRKGIVYVQNCRAGSIYETDTGYVFVYDADYLQNGKAVPVSLTLPVSTEEYRSTVLFPFFDGLIPEGWLLDLVSRNWKIDRNDRFGLLLSACKDSIGDVRIENEGDS